MRCTSLPHWKQYHSKASARRRSAPARPRARSSPPAAAANGAHAAAAGTPRPPDRHVVEIAVVADLEHHVALELVEELLDRIVVVVGALVRPADHLHGHVAVLEHLLVADRRLQQVLVLVDPFLEVEGLQSSGRHGLISLRHAALVAGIHVLLASKTWMPDKPAMTERHAASSLQPAGLERAARRLLLGVGQFQHRRAHRAADLAEQLLPVFRMRRRLLRPGASGGTPRAPG